MYSEIDRRRCASQYASLSASSSLPSTAQLRDSSTGSFARFSAQDGLGDHDRVAEASSPREKDILRITQRRINFECMA
jgi:hypothetical protein